MFKNLSIKKKLTILAILPLIALILLSFIIIIENNNKLNQYTKLENLVNLSAKISIFGNVKCDKSALGSYSPKISKGVCTFTFVKPNMSFKR